MQQQGYDSMSDQLNQILEDTEYEITHNAEKQQEVVQSMLNNVVNMYESAYGKINSIIENTDGQEAMLSVKIRHSYLHLQALRRRPIMQLRASQM